MNDRQKAFDKALEDGDLEERRRRGPRAQSREERQKIEKLLDEADKPREEAPRPRTRPQGVRRREDADPAAIPTP